MLVSSGPAAVESSTLAYGSTSANDASHGAHYVRIDPLETLYRGNGFIHPTYVYTSRLVSTTLAALGASAGRILDEMPVLRASLAQALGLGTGVTREANVRGSNRRGRLVETTSEVVEDWAVRHALVLTEPGYSRHGYHQIVVPLLDDGFELSHLDVQPPDTAWLQTLKRSYGRAILAVPMVSTLYLPDHIARFLDIVVPADVMARVELALVDHFGLEGYV